MKTKLLLLLLFCIKAHSQTWQFVGQDGISPSDAGLPSIALTSSGIPYVAYADGLSSEKATVMQFDGNSWQYVGIERFSDSIINYITIAIGKNDTPFVAYTDEAYSNGAIVKKFDGSNWVTVGMPGFSGQAIEMSFTIDNKGILYVAYSDVADSEKCSVMKYDGTNWLYVGNRGLSVGKAVFPYIIVDSGGTPYVAYEDEANFGKATVMNFDGINWLIVGTAGFTDTAAYLTHIAFDHDKSLYLAYVNGGQVNYKFNVMKFNNTAWIHVGPPSFSPGDADFPGIAFDKDNTPYVVFQNDSNQGQTSTWAATVMKFDGNNWVYVGENGFSHCWAYNTGIAIDTSGTPYVVYQDANLSGKTVVEKYALPTSIAPVISTNPDFNIYPNPTNGKLEIDKQNSTSNSLQIVVIDIAGQMLVRQTINPAVKNEIDVSALPAGLYFIQLQDEQQMMVKKFVKE